MKSFVILFGLLLVALFSKSQVTLNEEQYLQLPDSIFDIANAALLIEKEINPLVNIQGVLHKIDSLTIKIRNQITGEETELELIKLLNKNIFNNELVYSDTCIFLSHFFDNKCRQCLSGTIIYLAITKRLNLNFHGSFAPIHSFVKYTSKHNEYKIETVENGNIDSISIADIKNVYYPAYTTLFPYNHKFYFRDNTPKELIASLICTRGLYYLQRKNNPEKGLKDFLKAQVLFPKFPDVYEHIGEAKLLMGDTLSFMNNNRLALLMDSLNPRAWNNLALFYKKFDVDMAIECVNNSIYIDSVEGNSYRNRAILYDVKGKYNQSIVDNKRALSLGLDGAAIYYDVAHSYQRLNNIDSASASLIYKLQTNRNIDTAIYYYQLAIKEDASHRDSYSNLSMLYLHKSEYSSVFQICNSAIELGVNTEYVYNNRGSSYSHIGNYTDAIKDFDRALEINPNSSTSYYNRCYSKYMIKDYVGSCSDCKKALELGSSNRDSILYIIKDCKE